MTRSPEQEREYRNTPKRKAYMKEYQNNWMRKRRAAFFEDKCCIKCGSTQRLELDHINPREKTTHNIWSLKESRRLEEIDKCQVLCNDCHKKKTSKNGENAHVGENNPGSILNDFLANEIREKYKEGKGSYSFLAKEYGVAKGTIADLIQGKTWKHLLYKQN